MNVLSHFGSGARPLDGARVLVVDDEAPIRQLFQMILSTSLPGVTVEQACNGLEAVRLFEEGHHGLLLMDLRMPVMDGLQAFMAVQNICRQEKLQVPRVVFCSGFVPPESVQEIVGEGDYHFLLQKPVQSKQLVDAVRNRLELK